jgi:hypothetical protein
LVISVPGFHKHIAKIDVYSLYPSIMFKYGVRSRNDTQRVGLQQIVIKPGTRIPPPTPSPQAMRGLERDELLSVVEPQGDVGKHLSLF